MAVNISIYSNTNTTSKSIAFDFVGDVLAANSEWNNANTSSVEYYFKITTGAQDSASAAFPAKVVRSLDELALNGTAATRKQAATNTANAYSDIRSMIVDYTYDFITGHLANTFSSACTLQLPMKFT